MAESLCLGYDLNDLGKRFVMWYDENYWTADNEVFDIGNTTRNAIDRLRRGTQTPWLAGDFEEDCNGNGSLMRIMPLLFYIRDFDIEKRFAHIKDVSAVTHGHIRSKIACFYYLEYALELLKGRDKHTAYANTAKTVYDHIVKKQIAKSEVDKFASLLKEDISKKDVESIPSWGYVMNTLQASMYCFLNTDNYKDATLMAVNLGNDADTTAAVTGGLAGLYYGFESIPEKWRNEVKRSNDIKNLCDRLAKAMGI
ncbi:MAG: ADP-ribosylglycohydrolase family protein [Niastella sp.]|uniref:ADP-ribosylglycohydrolase family protein n=1 Tax=Niastella sp. TaxID=1869183 RepID=UPI00389A8DA5